MRNSKQIDNSNCRIRLRSRQSPAVSRHTAHHIAAVPLATCITPSLTHTRFLHAAAIPAPSSSPTAHSHATLCPFSAEQRSPQIPKCDHMHLSRVLASLYLNALTSSDSKRACIYSRPVQCQCSKSKFIPYLFDVSATIADTQSQHRHQAHQPHPLQHPHLTPPSASTYAAAAPSATLASISHARLQRLTIAALHSDGDGVHQWLSISL